MRNIRNKPGERWEILYEGYLISNKGRVYSIKRSIILKQNLNSSGYRRVTIGKKHIFIHIKVVELFGDCKGNHLPDGETLREFGISIDHIDGNKKNNQIENLEIVSHAENCLRRSARMKIYA